MSADDKTPRVDFNWVTACIVHRAYNCTLEHGKEARRKSGQMEFLKHEESRGNRIAS